ncbi:MAG: hydantoinase/carbamoylase family amidase [Pseudomonadota bacterium]
MADMPAAHETHPSTGFAVPDDVRQISIDTFARLRDMSFDGVGVSRETYGPTETAAMELVADVATSEGLTVDWDDARNLILRLPGEDADAATVATGSHLDSVPEGGNYDGAAGVIAGMAVLIAARRMGTTPNRTLEVYGLRGEESAWFGGPCYFGSRALFGQLTDTDFETVHRGGTKTLADSMRETGANMERLQRADPLIDPASMACWLELHIEQGPVLIAREKPVGIVTGIRGNHRHRRVTCYGEAAHSGAVPRWLRKDAVLAMADLMVRIDEHWRVLLEWGEDLVVTSGIVETNPKEHAVSRVPGEVSFALEYRSQDLKTLKSFEALLHTECDKVAAERNVRFDLGTPVLTSPATMSPKLRELVESVCVEQKTDYEILPSGAGHDSSVFANAGIPSGMIFVRNDKGSHNPREAMDYDDFFLATNVLGGAMLTAADGNEEYR